jgi:hypothetical protein
VFALLLVGACYVLGFRIGRKHWLCELARVRMDARQAELRLHDLTREAFVAMAELVERQPSS